MRPSINITESNTIAKLISTTIDANIRRKQVALLTNASLIVLHTYAATM